LRRRPAHATGVVLAVFRAPLGAIQRRCKRSADGLRFHWTPDLLTADWLTTERQVSGPVPRRNK